MATRRKKTTTVEETVKTTEEAKSKFKNAKDIVLCPNCGAVLEVSKIPFAYCPICGRDIPLKK